MLERVILQFEPDRLERLRGLAATRGVSLAALVREATDALLEDGDADERWRAALDVVGRHRSGLRDLGRDHDRYLSEPW